jgi:predicted permease
LIFFKYDFDAKDKRQRTKDKKVMNNLWQDLRYAARMLIKKPGFSLIAVVTLALGIGANTALFSVVDAMLLKKLSVKEPDRLVLFKSLSGSEFNPGSYTGSSMKDKTGLQARTSFPYQSYKRLREQESVLSDLFAFGSVRLSVNADGAAEVVAGQAVSGNYYSGLGVNALYGRLITDEDDQTGAGPVAVFSYRYWQRRFGSDPSIIGTHINLNNVAFTIIGITPPGFDGTMQVGSSQDVSIPIATEPLLHSEPDRSMMYGAGMWWLRLMGRLKPEATAEQAQASLESVFQESVIEHRTARQKHAQAQPLRPAPPVLPLEEKDYPRLGVDSGSQGEMNTRNYYATSLYILLGVVGLVLLIACANVANLLLARAASRQKEIAVRLAVGASRWRLIRQLLTESLLLAVSGGLLGLLFALWIKDGLLAVEEWGGGWRLTSLEVNLDMRVFAFTLGLSCLTGILFGIAPAWRATRIDLTPALKESGRSSSTASRSLLSKSLVVAQVAMSLLLMVGAGLFLRTLINLQQVETGFNPNSILLFSVDPGLIGYKGDKLVNVYKQISERIEAVPGVQSVTFSRTALLSQSSSTRSFYLPGVAPGADGRTMPSGDIYVHQVRENFLEAMEIPLTLGRNLTEQDNEKSPRVAVVNQAFAQRYFPDQDPIGKRFGYSPDKNSEVEIVGIARDAKYTRQRDEVPPTAYLCWLQELRSVNSIIFEVRTSVDPKSSVSAIREAVAEVDSNLPLSNIKTQIEQADQTLSMERLFAKLLSLFGLLAQQLASIGLYGVLAWSVSQRTREIGIRQALGASRRDVLMMILRQGMTLTLIGIALGLTGAYVLTRYLKSMTDMLYGVDVADPFTFGAVSVLLTLVALVACYLPAYRATRVDPMTALRYE